MKASEIGTLESHLVLSESQTEIGLRGRGSLAYVRTGFRISEYLSGLLVPPTGGVTIFHEALKDSRQFRGQSSM